MSYLDVYYNFLPDGEFHEDLYEKWLRRRLDYASIRKTGHHIAPGLVHTLLHNGNCHNAVASELREEMWTRHKYPHSKFFTHGIARYECPEVVREILDLRFAQAPAGRLRQDLATKDTPDTCRLSFQDLSSVSTWNYPLLLAKCPYPHQLETPLTWARLHQEQLHSRMDGKDPARVNQPVFPYCCRGQDYVCSSVYCRSPLPEAVYNPGPLSKGDALIKWHLDVYRGK
ncbi:unnamed protein product [Lymnaea stagnalis]|uniref:Uncharacterized protein n=1 Tax=Lymnaea stagnalis TaxID=6523 RepID=A0AAV2H262_LYMST